MKTEKEKKRIEGEVARTERVIPHIEDGGREREV